MTKIKITSLPANGTLYLNGIAVTADQEINVADLANLTFVPNANWNGSTSFGWNGFDGTVWADSNASVNITVNAVNDKPTLSNVTKSGNEDATISFTAADFTSQFSDVDGDAMTKIKITSLPANGTLYLNGIAVTADQEINVADLANLTFAPNANWNGSTSFGWNGFDGTAYADVAASVNITVNAAPRANLSIAKTVDKPSASFGETVIFSITVTNNGDANATGVEAIDKLPNGYNYVSDNGAGTYNSSTGVWTIGNLNNGASVSLSITATVNETGNFTNTATVSADQKDPDSDNNSSSVTINPTDAADIAVTIRTSNPRPSYGDRTLFIINVTNYGPSRASGVVLTALLSDGLRYIPTKGDYIYNPITGEMSIGSLEVGQSLSLPITTLVNSTGDYNVSSNVVGTTYDPNPSNNNAVLPITPTVSNNIILTKKVDNTNPYVADNVTFTLTVTNNGPNTATNVVVTDNLPDGFTAVSVTPSVGNWAAPAWTIGNMPTGQVVTLKMIAKVNASGTYTNVATLSSDTNIDDPDNATDEVTVTPVPVANLLISKVVDNETVSVGSDVTFTITVSNNGPSTAQNVVVTDNLPNGFTLVSATPSAGSWNFPLWTLGDMVNNQVETITIVATVNATGSYTNNATASSDTQDLSSGNNSDEVTVYPNGKANLAIAKVVDNATANVGENVKFTITVTNNGPSVAQNVVVTDNLPNGYTFISATPSVGNWNDPLWTIGDMANGEVVTLEIEATVNPSGNYTNKATVSSDTDDSSNDDNNSEVTVYPNGVANLAITKVVDNSTPVVGSNVKFTITVTNNGPSKAENVVVTDNLPSGFSLVSSIPSVGSWTAPLWSVGEMANGETVSIEIVAKVNTTGDYTNTASVTSDTQSTTNDDDKEDKVTVDPQGSAYLTLSKTVDNIIPTVGSNVVFTITVTNNGPSKAENVVVTDVLPNGFSFVSANPSFGTWLAPEWAIGQMAAGQVEKLEIVATVNPSGTYTNTAKVSSDTDNPNTDKEEDDVTVYPNGLTNLAITKTIDNPNALAGDEVVFTLTVTNSGPSNATGVKALDKLPSGYSYVSDNGNGSYNSSTGEWTIGSLNNGASVSINITAIVDAFGDYLNLATVTGDQHDPDGDNDTDGVTLTNLSNLSISKTVDNSSPNIGETVVFTITVKNNGPSNATGVKVIDNLPSGYTLVSAVPSVGSWANPEWIVGTLSNGSSASILITATVNASGDYTNVASIGGDQGDTDEDSNTDTVTVVPGATSNLSMAKAVDNAAANVGENVVFTITVKNNGPSHATSVTATDKLPDGFTYISHTGAGTYNPATGEWTIGSLNNGASVTLSITATVNASGDYRNVATVDGDQNDNENDNNSDSVEVYPGAVINLSIAKTVDNPTAKVGDVVVFTLRATNAGPSDATGVTATDKLPSGYTFISDDGTGAYNQATGLWTIGSLANGAIAMLKINAQVNPSGNYTNIALIDGDQHDDDSDGNTGTATLTNVVDLSITKTVDSPAALVGEEVVFTISVKNAGTTNATGVTVTDNLPSGFTLVSVNPSVGSWSAPVWTIGDLDAGITETLEIRATVNPSGDYTNVANVTSDQGDTDGDNNTGSVVVTPGATSNLIVSKEVDKLTPFVGDQVIFTITVKNNGPSAATGVVVTDNMPSGFTLVNATPSIGSWSAPTWNVGSLENGASATLQLIATVNLTGSYTNVATVTGDQHDDDTDTNTDEVTLTPIGVSNLSITKTSNKTNALVGDEVVFTLTVTNSGPSLATNVKAIDQLPSGFTYVSDNGNGSYSQSTGVWTIGNIPNNQSVSLDITAKVNPSGNYTNVATVSGNEHDNDNDDNSSEVTINTASGINLTIAKTVNKLKPVVNTNVEFTVTVGNSGANTANGVVVTDNLPTGYTFVSSAVSKGTNNLASNGTWAVGSLASGETATLTVVATILAEGNFENTATVIADLDQLGKSASAEANPIFAPIAHHDKYTVPYKGSKVLEVTSNDTDRNNGLVYSSVRIVEPLRSGASAVANIDGTITVNYEQKPEFSGNDYLVYEISNIDGLSDTAKVYLSVQPEDIIIPDTFSPNDDGVNDTFIIPGIELYPGNELIVYNRWGNIVFRMMSYDNSWNGSARNTNEKLPVGTYFYTITLGKNLPTMKGYIYLTK
jgi:uncharacterized repeat protein (TIGR01451 family)/gliding motility-associated-like protein